MSRVPESDDPYYGGLLGFNALAMPARYALERSDWEAAARLAAPEDGGPAFVRAVPRFARAVGAARSGRPEMAQSDIDALEVLESDLAESGEAAWAVRGGAPPPTARAVVVW